MSHISAQDGASGHGAFYAGIQETHIAALSAEHSEETGVVLGTVWGEVADDMSSSVEVDTVPVCIVG